MVGWIDDRKGGSWIIDGWVDAQIDKTGDTPPPPDVLNLESSLSSAG